MEIELTEPQAKTEFGSISIGDAFLHFDCIFMKIGKGTDQQSGESVNAVRLRSGKLANFPDHILTTYLGGVFRYTAVQEREECCPYDV